MKQASQSYICMPFDARTHTLIKQVCNGKRFCESEDMMTVHTEEFAHRSEKDPFWLPPLVCLTNQIHMLIHI